MINKVIADAVRNVLPVSQRIGALAHDMLQTEQHLSERIGECKVLKVFTITTKLPDGVTKIEAADPEAKAAFRSAVENYWCALPGQVDTRYDVLSQADGTIRVHDKGAHVLTAAWAIGLSKEDAQKLAGKPDQIATLRGKVRDMRKVCSSFFSTRYDRWERMANDAKRERGDPATTDQFTAQHVDAICKRNRKDKVELETLLATVTKRISAAYATK